MQWISDLRLAAFGRDAARSSSSAPYERITLGDLEHGGSKAEEGGLLADDDDARLSSESAASSRFPPPSPTPSSSPASKPEISRGAFFFWVGVNCLATLGIVLVNKKILVNPTLRGAPTLFVAYHFFLTSLVLHLASSSVIGAFPRKAAPVLSLLPLALVFAAHTVVTNWSLALLEVAIYQEMRILVTPATVIINYLAYRKSISFQSLLALVVVCSGIGLTVYSDTLQKLAIQAAAAAASSAPSSVEHVRRLVTRAESIHSLKNTPIGYLFGMGGVFLSALYTVWMAVYLKKLELSSMQLLHLNAPLGTALLLVATLFLDTLPVWSNITSAEVLLLFMSGMFAVLINVSQFFIVAGSSALSSTVVGHFKTVLLVGAGWLLATSAISLGSGVGILIALVGIFAYSAIGLTTK